MFVPTAKVLTLKRIINPQGPVLLRVFGSTRWSPQARRNRRDSV